MFLNICLSLTKIHCNSLDLFQHITNQIKNSQFNFYFRWFNFWWFNFCSKI